MSDPTATLSSSDVPRTKKKKKKSKKAKKANGLGEGSSAGGVVSSLLADEGTENHFGVPDSCNDTPSSLRIEALRHRRAELEETYRSSSILPPNRSNNANAPTATASNASTVSAQALANRLDQQLKENEMLQRELNEIKQTQHFQKELEDAERATKDLQEEIVEARASTGQRAPDPPSLGVTNADDSFMRGYSALHNGSSPRPSNFQVSDMLQLTIKDHGERANGIVFVELWVVRGARLFRPDFGWWMHHDIDHGDDQHCHLCQLTVPSRSDYIPPGEHVFGEGVPGVLWSESNRNVRSSDSPHRVMWRQLKAIANDPLQPLSPRLNVMAECELDMAAAVAFNISGVRGLVIWMSNASREEVLQTTDETFLAIATDHIAATYAVRLPREVATQALRQYERNQLKKQLAGEGGEDEELGGTLHTMALSDDAGDTKLSSGRLPCCSTVKQEVVTYAKKFKGGGLKPPPAFSWEQTAWAFVGSMISLIAITRLDQFMAGGGLGVEATLIIGPFGAYVVLLYGLTAAPASQPRNALVGNVIGMLVGQGIGYLSPYVELWLRMPLASATATAIMVKAGCTHPPGGALALIFSAGVLPWTKVYIQLCGTVVAIGTAAIINNLNPKRQYPTYWGLVDWMGWIRQCFSTRKGD